MKQLKIQKTDEGFVLRPSGSQMAKILLMALLMLAIGVFCCLIPWLARDGAIVWDFQTFLYLVLGLFGVTIGGLLLYFYVGLRVVVDGAGVRRYRFSRCTFDMPWKHVKSWGVTSVKTKVKYHTTEQYYLYFSAEAGERTGKSCISLPISPKEWEEIRGSGLHGFVAARRQGEGEE